MLLTRRGDKRILWRMAKTKLKTYAVTLQITGSMFIEVEAEDENDAVSKAVDDVTIDNLEGWEPTPAGADVNEV